MDIRRCIVVLLFCLFVGVCVCLGKVLPCVAVNQYIFSLPLAQIPAPASGGERETEREKEGEMRRNLGVRNVGVID